MLTWGMQHSAPYSVHADVVNDRQPDHGAHIETATKVRLDGANLVVVLLSAGWH
jgi:hypothetical protein